MHGLLRAGHDMGVACDDKVQGGADQGAGAPAYAGGQAAAANPLQHPVVRQAAQQAVATIDGLQQKAAVLGQQLNALQQDRTIESRKVEIDAFKAQTERLKAVGERIGKV